MTLRLAFDSLQRQPLMAAAAVLFMAASTFILALTMVMSCQLFGSIENLMDQAQVPDVLQMHAGKADENMIADFARQYDGVEAWQLCTFLNLENSDLQIGDQSLVSSSQDNGLCSQSECFDFLLDLSGNVARPGPGEVYVPVAYRELYDIEIGDELKTGGRTLTIAGFIRDAQMNAMLCSSKRFLVHEQTLALFRNAGQEETLIEFMLIPDIRPSVFRQAYEDAGLPASGPFIDRSLILVMNALSDGTVIFLLLLVSAAVIAISILCIRYILAMQLEQDSKVTGMMKALGISHRAIRRIYLVRYLLLAVPGVLTGLFLALSAAQPMMQQIHELYGAAPVSRALPAVCFVAMLITAGILLLSVRISLRSIDRQSPLDALHTVNAAAKTRPGLMSGLVCAGCMFLILVPVLLTNTLSSPAFVTNMGIGNAQLRLDFSMKNKTAETVSGFENDDRIDQWTMLETCMEKAVLADGTQSALPVETGNHLVFPVTLDQGHLPSKREELALSVLAAQELGLECQDQIWLEGQKEPFVICGIYSDITNGGISAKAAALQTESAAVWQVAYVTLKKDVNEQAWTESFRKEGVSVTSIQNYVQQAYAQTLDQLKLMSLLAICIGVFITLMEIFLALRLFVLQNSRILSLKKALGFTAGQLKKEWFAEEFLWCAGGTIAGLLLAIGPGQWICSLVLQHLGAAGFHFEIPWGSVSGLLVLVFFSALASAWLGLSVISRISPCECVRGKENL